MLISKKNWLLDEQDFWTQKVHCRCRKCPCLSSYYFNGITRVLAFLTNCPFSYQLIRHMTSSLYFSFEFRHILPNSKRMHFQCYDNNKKPIENNFSWWGVIIKSILINSIKHNLKTKKRIILRNPTRNYLRNTLSGWWISGRANKPDTEPDNSFHLPKY